MFITVQINFQLLSDRRINNILRITYNISFVSAIRLAIIFVNSVLLQQTVITVVYYLDFILYYYTYEYLAPE